MADAAKSEHSRKKFSISFLRIPSCSKPSVSVSPAIQHAAHSINTSSSVARDSTSPSTSPSPSPLRAASQSADLFAPATAASASSTCSASGGLLAPTARSREGSYAEQQRRTSAGGAVASAYGDERDVDAPTRCATAVSARTQRPLPRRTSPNPTFQRPEAQPQETHSMEQQQQHRPQSDAHALSGLSGGKIARRVRSRKLGAIFQLSGNTDDEAIETVRHCAAHAQLQQHQPPPQHPHTNPPHRRLMEKPSIAIQPSIDDYGGGSPDLLNDVNAALAHEDGANLSASSCNLLSFGPTLDMPHMPMRLRRTTVSASERYLEEVRRNIEGYNNSGDGSGSGSGSISDAPISARGVCVAHKTGLPAAPDAECAYDSLPRSRRYTLGERSSPNLRVSSPLARSPLARSRGSLGSSGQMADAPLPPSLNHLSAVQLELLREQSSKALTQILRELCPNFKFERRGWFFKKWLKRRKAHKGTFDCERSSSPARQQLRSKSRTPPQTHVAVSAAQYPVFGLSLEQLQRIYRRPLPPAVLALMRHLLATCEREEAVGIFRRAGNRGHVRALRAALESSGDGSVGESLAPEFNVYDVADVLKQFFREIPDCLLTSKLSEAVINIYLNSGEEHHAEAEQRFSALQALVVLLPDAHREALRLLLAFVARLARLAHRHQMTTSNLAVCLAPSLFYFSSTFSIPRSAADSTGAGGTRLEAESAATDSVGASDASAAAARAISSSGGSGGPKRPEMKELLKQKAAHRCLTDLIDQWRALFESDPPTDELPDALRPLHWSRILQQAQSSRQQEEAANAANRVRKRSRVLSPPSTLPAALEASGQRPEFTRGVSETYSSSPAIATATSVAFNKLRSGSAEWDEWVSSDGRSSFIGGTASSASGVPSSPCSGVEVAVDLIVGGYIESLMKSHRDELTRRCGSSGGKEKSPPRDKSGRHGGWVPVPVPRELTVSLLLANLRAYIGLKAAPNSDAAIDSASASASAFASPEHIAELRKRADSNALAVLNLSYRVAGSSDSASLMSAVTVAASSGGLQACECTAAVSAASSLGASPLPTWRASIEICAPAERLFDRVLRERSRWDAECCAFQVLVELSDCSDVVRLALLDAYSINPLTLQPMQREYMLLRRWRVDEVTGTCIIIATQYDPRARRERRLSSQTGAQITRSQERLWLAGPCGSKASDTTRTKQRASTSIGDRYHSTSTTNLTSPRASDTPPAPPGLEARAPAFAATASAPCGERDAAETAAAQCSDGESASELLVAPLQALAYEATFVIDPLGAERSRVTLYSREDVRGKSVGWYERQWALECCRLLVALKDSFHAAGTGTKAAPASSPSSPSDDR